MFEKASRLKVRFPFRGQCSVEDLWDLRLQDLDSIYKVLARTAKAQEEESLLEVKTAENEILDLQINIVKHVVAVKVAEQNARKDRELKAVQKQKLLGIIETKQDEALLNMPLEDLQKLVNEL